MKNDVAKEVIKILEKLVFSIDRLSTEVEQLGLEVFGIRLNDDDIEE